MHIFISPHLQSLLLPHPPSQLCLPYGALGDADHENHDCVTLLAVSFFCVTYVSVYSKGRRKDFTFVHLVTEIVGELELELPPLIPAFL